MALILEVAPNIELFQIGSAQYVFYSECVLAA